MQGNTSNAPSAKEDIEGQLTTERKPVGREIFVPEPLLDSDEAAAIMRIHPKTLQRYARQGIVRGFQIGSLWRFRASDIDRWILEQLAG